MLANTHDLVQDATRKGYALGAFNTYNLELTNAVLRAAERQQSPVILQLGAGQLKYGGYEQLVGLCLGAARAACVPVALHLDHGTKLEDVQRALDAGFTSVMIDGSRLDFEANVELTMRAGAMAHAQAKIIEAELGRLAGSEDAANPVEPSGEMTNPEQAAQFVARTGVDLLAVCIGNVHGFYVGEPRLDFERLDAIRTHVSIPLVVHGTSGLSDEIIRALIARGVVKFNLNTELRVALFETLQRALGHPHAAYDVAKLMQPVMDAVASVVEHKLQLFGSTGKA